MLLAPYRVLDLSETNAQLAGQMLAQLGADVIAIEPPEGVASRLLAPFVGGRPDREGSLVHLAWNRGKRSVVVDTRTQSDITWLRSLIAGADVLIDDGPGGMLASAGLDDDELASLNPALVHVSVTPFGLDGPKRGWAASDLTVWAAAGPLALTGDADRPPVPVGVPQAYVHAAAEAVGAALIALHERATSGLGQRVDVSAQQCAGAATQAGILAAPNGATSYDRGEVGGKAGAISQRRLWPCRDGLVLIMFLFGSALGPFTRRLLEWVHEEGFCDDATRDKDWVAYTTLLTSGEEPVSEYERVLDVLADFCRDKTKQELLDGAMRRSLLIAPVHDIGDVMTWSQLEARDWWVNVDGKRRPGAFGRLSATPMAPVADAPRLGAHTAEVLDEQDRTELPPAPSGASRPVRSAPLAGLKVLDFSWVIAGPTATRTLADYGATIVRVESGIRIETGRTIPPFHHDRPGVDQSVLYGNCNCGKLDVTLNLASPAGRAVALDLVRWADVVTESFSPKAMRAWGLDYPKLREVNPSIVMMSSSLLGADGPISTLAGFGPMASALAGFFDVTGWPDRLPCGPFGAYTDYLAPRFATAVLLAAIDHRRRTGEGQHIDFSQTEAALQGLAPALLRHAIDGHGWPRHGTSDPNYAPHGVFPCVGGRWVALSCGTEAQRAALTAITGLIDDASISAWTSTRTADDAMLALQAVGVAAHAVQNSVECVADPQLRHRGHFLELVHPATGSMTVEGPRAHLLATPGVVRRPPTLGEHTVQVLTEILRYDDERIAELLGDGALE